MTALAAHSVRWLSRIGALALPLALAAALVFGLVAPILDAARDAARQADEQRALIARYAAISAEHDQIAAELAADRAAQSESRLFVAGATPALAAAALQERLSRIVADAGGVMHAASGDHGPDVDGLEQVSVEARFDADIAQLTQILYRIETEEPLLFVGRLSVTGQIRGEGERIVARRSLGVSMTLSGYRLASSSGEDRT